MGLDTLSQKNTVENGAPTTGEAGGNAVQGSSRSSTTPLKVQSVNVQSVSEGSAYSVTFLHSNAPIFLS